MTVLVNGEPVSTINVADRGLQYGDGLFETIAWRHQQLEHWEAHMLRLSLGCDRLDIKLPDTTKLKEECLAVAEQQQLAVIKIIITRGAGGRGYKPDSETMSTRIVASHPWPEDMEKYAAQGINCSICKLRLSINPVLAGIKHLNRLEQVLASHELENTRFQEGLLLDSDNRLISGTKSNIFLVRNNTLYTPDLTRTGIAGVMRANILAIAPSLGLAVNIQDLHVGELRTAEEIFVTNSIIGLWPVRSIDNSQYNIAQWTRKIQQIL
jgi:4-amino-4-deoxychorismate lyase